jgi:hypothetical protein
VRIVEAGHIDADAFDVAFLGLALDLLQQAGGVVGALLCEMAAVEAGQCEGKGLELRCGLSGEDCPQDESGHSEHACVDRKIVSIKSYRSDLVLHEELKFLQSLYILEFHLVLFQTVAEKSLNFFLQKDSLSFDSGYL